MRTGQYWKSVANKTNGFVDITLFSLIPIRVSDIKILGNKVALLIMTTIKQTKPAKHMTHLRFHT